MLKDKIGILLAALCVFSLSPGHAGAYTKVTPYVTELEALRSVDEPGAIATSQLIGGKNVLVAMDGFTLRRIRDAAETNAEARSVALSSAARDLALSDPQEALPETDAMGTYRALAVTRFLDMGDMFAEQDDVIIARHMKRLGFSDDAIVNALQKYSPNVPRLVAKRILMNLHSRRRDPGFSREISEAARLTGSAYCRSEIDAVPTLSEENKDNARSFALNIYANILMERLEKAETMRLVKEASPGRHIAVTRAMAKHRHGRGAYDSETAGCFPNGHRER